jgi:uncharacterized membrane protein YgcG
MRTKNAQKILSVTMSLLLFAGSPQISLGYQDPSSPQDAGTTTDSAPQTASQLQALVAPIALYPDALVAQVLAASTFPDQVAVAEYWMQQNKSLTGSALMQAVDKQSWDPSVKALTQFPSVLDNLSKNLSWTSSLGEAYHDQAADVMTAIQTLRAQAKEKGNLKSTPQITVVQQSPQTIVIQSANPQVVYVPQYNPAVIYGYPYVVPSYVAPVYSTGDMVAASMLSFGAGIAVGAMMSGGCCGWGYSSWNCGWHGTAVIYHGGGYYGNSAWHGGYYNGGYHNSYGYNNAYNHSGNNYNNYHGGNTYNKNTVNVNRQSAQSFNSDRSSASNSWAQHDSSAGKSTAFSGMSGHSGGFGGSGGWSSRAESGRGWGSMRSSGFSGGRFGGGGGGFGGGGFRR